MATRNIERILSSAEALTPDELLEAAQRLIERARAKSPTSVDVNSLAGILTLEEDPMAIQERMRREWE